MSSNVTLELITSYDQRTHSTETTFSTPSRPLPARRTETRGAYHPQVKMSRPSEAQTAFIKSLLADVIELDAEQGEKLRRLANEMWTDGKLTPGREGGASHLIENLKDLRTALRDRAAKAAPTAKREVPAVPAGRYAVNTEEGHLAFYKVTVSDKGFVNVYLQVSDDFQRLSWTAALGVLRKIMEISPLEASKAYGHGLGCCGVCGRTLTNPESISLGIGPKCMTRFGG